MSFRKEQSIAGLFIASVALFLIGLILVRASASSSRYRTSRESRLQSERTILAAKLFMGSGVALFAVTLAGGAMIAFGIGPSWLGKTVQRARVEERILLSADGYQSFNEDLYDIPGARYYLRVRLPGGEVSEFLCPQQVYMVSRIGDSCDIKVMGQRITEYRRLNVR